MAQGDKPVLDAQRAKKFFQCVGSCDCEGGYSPYPAQQNPSPPPLVGKGTQPATSGAGRLYWLGPSLLAVFSGVTSMACASIMRCASTRLGAFAIVCRATIEAKNLARSSSLTV